MGHETEEQTAVYLEDLDDQPIAEEMNRALNYEKEKNETSAKKKGTTFMTIGELYDYPGSLNTFQNGGCWEVTEKEKHLQ